MPFAFDCLVFEMNAFRSVDGVDDDVVCESHINILAAKLNAIHRNDALMCEDEARDGEEMNQSSNMFQATALKPEPGLMSIDAEAVLVTQL